MKLYSLLLLFMLPEAFAQSKSVGELGHQWKKKDVRVCWLDMEKGKNTNVDRSFLMRYHQDFLEKRITLPEADKRAIQEKIQTEFLISRTGIQFVGWESCKKSKNYDLEIIIANNPDEVLGQATVGDFIRYDEMFQEYTSNSSLSYVFLNTAPKENTLITPQENLLLTALHEFGHVAGLRHEHIRKEAKEDPACGKNFSTWEKRYRDSAYFTSYDPMSIMNYCFLDTLTYKTTLTFPLDKLPGNWKDDSIVLTNGRSSVNVKIGLSTKDVHSLKCLYVYGKEEFSQKCSDPKLP